MPLYLIVTNLEADFSIALITPVSILATPNAIISSMETKRKKFICTLIISTSKASCRKCSVFFFCCVRLVHKNKFVLDARRYQLVITSNSRISWPGTANIPDIVANLKSSISNQTGNSSELLSVLTIDWMELGSMRRINLWMKWRATLPNQTI